MARRFRATAAAAMAIVLAATAGFSYLQLAGTAPAMTESAQQFLASLDDQQRSRAQMEFDDRERLDWHFIPKAHRKGLQLGDMNDQQRQAAHRLLESALGESGYRKTTQIVALESLLRELEQGRGPVRDPGRYYFTIFGEPAGDARWALSVEGHHLSLNWVVEGSQVVSTTPAMMGANPAEIRTDTFGIEGLERGLRVLGDEEAIAFELLHALAPQQRRQAVISDEPLREIRAAGEPQPPQTPPEGIAASELDDDQRRILRRLIGAYVTNMPEDIRRERVEAIRESGPENIHFAWAGADQPGSGHYYRVQGPTFLIEFVNTQPDASGNPANHIHCVWRDLQGDFGIPIAG